MTTVQYYHGSLFGTYLVDCEVLEKLSDSKFHISFFDPISQEQDHRIVDKMDLKFPDFAEYLI